MARLNSSQIMDILDRQESREYKAISLNKAEEYLTRMMEVSKLVRDRKSHEDFLKGCLAMLRALDIDYRISEYGKVELGGTK